MASKPNSIICSYGAEIIQKHLKSFQKEIRGVSESRNLEFVHRMRVASRRLARAITIFQSCLPAKRLRLWQKDIRQATRTLGRARDLDIQAACVKRFLRETAERPKRPGIMRLHLRLIQKRKRVQRVLLNELDNMDKHQTLVHIENQCRLIKRVKQELSSPDASELREFANQAILPILDKFLSYDAFVEQVEAIEELHAMRIAAKKLRYTLECFATLYPEKLAEYLTVMRMIQDQLGIIHDCDVWQATGGEFIEDERRRTVKYYGNERAMKRLMPGLLAFFTDCQRRRQETYASFVGYWNELRIKQTWERLRDVSSLGREVITTRSG